MLISKLTQRQLGFRNELNAGPLSIMANMLGVLGGMGPAATADFLSKLVSCTPAARDSDHIPVVVTSIPQIPDRTEAILHDAASPLPMMEGCLQNLKQAGADCIVIPCNTAHYWFDCLEAHSAIEWIHIADAVMEFVKRHKIEATSIGLLATPGTIASGVYPRRIGDRARFVEPSLGDLDSLVLPAIRAVKAGRSTEAEPLLSLAASNLFNAGATCIVMACTEIPLAMHPTRADDMRFIDSTVALAEACVRKFCKEPAAIARY